MKRVASKTGDVVNLSEVAKPVKVCVSPGCGKVLTQSQKKFCSYTCRNAVLSPGNSGGRPSAYKPEYATDELSAYIEACERGHQPTVIPARNSQIVLQNAKLPTLEGFATHVGVSVETLRNWAREHSALAQALDRVKDVQRSYLIDNGLSGRYNAQIAKLLLGVNHGMSEKVQAEQNKIDHFGLVKHLYRRADEIERERYGKENAG